MKKPERMPTQSLSRSKKFSLPVRQERKAENLRKTSCRSRYSTFAGMLTRVCSCTMAVVLIGALTITGNGECTRQCSGKIFSPLTQRTNLNPAINAKKMQILVAQCKNIFMFDLQAGPNGANRAKQLRRVMAADAKVRNALIAREIM